MNPIASRLMDVVQQRRPDLYRAVLRHIQPYSLASVLGILERHLLAAVPDLRVFNEHAALVPDFVWSVVKHMRFPTPGDAAGIFIISRLTKSDTQCALDSKHVPAVADSPLLAFNVEKDVLDELALFSNHIQLFELANRHRYATAFMSPDTTIAYLAGRLPQAGILERGLPANKARLGGALRYLREFRYFLVEDRGSVKVLYRSLHDLHYVMRCVPLAHFAAFSDVRCLFKKGGSPCAFFNMLEVARRQLFVNDGSRYEKDVTSVLTYMFCRGDLLLPMNREGLAKNKDKPPIDVLSFEAMKRNCARIATGPRGGVWHEVRSSCERIFHGIQFNEGTGYAFTLLEKPPAEVEER